METLNHQSYPEYVMFGTYRSNAKTIDFDTEGIKFMNVCPNSMETRFRYHIMIPFIEMQELMFCRNSSLNAIFVKPTKVSNYKIQECMYLGKDSKNGFKFDIDSEDSREHYLIAVLKNKLSTTFIEKLKQISKNKLPNIVSTRICVRRAKQLLDCSQYRLTNLNNGCDQQIVDLTDQINCSTPKPQPNGLKSIEFNFNPIDILFGTYKCDVKEVVFTLRDIKLIDIPVNINAANALFLHELIIELNEISKICYITQDSKISLLILTKESFNQRVRETLNIGINSPNKLIFDINSSDKRENNFIIVLNDEFPQLFTQYLTQISKNKDLNFELEAISSESANELIVSAKTQNEFLTNKWKVFVMATEIIRLRNNCDLLKRKCDQLDESNLFCAICLESKNEILSKNKKVVSTTCGHIFCKECLERALNNRSVCPTCVKSIKKTKIVVESYHELHL